MILEGSDYFVWYENLPYQVHGMTITNGDGTYSIILNSHDTVARQQKAFNHELTHITRNDFYSGKDIREVENL